MKFLLFIFVLGFFVSCEEFRYERESDDGSISGTVSFISSQLGMASAMAQTPEDYQYEISNAAIAGDFFTMYSSSVYSDLVTSAVDDAQYYVTEASGLISSNVLSYGYGDFPDGILVAFGFNENKKLVSLNFAAVDAAGKYSLKDPAHRSVSFYKLSFALNSAGTPKYRLGYIFRDGYKMVGNVTYTSSMASVKLTEEIGKDPNKTLSELKQLRAKFVREVTNQIPPEDHRVLLNMYVSNHYSRYPDLDVVQKFVLESSLFHAMRSDQEFSSAALALEDAFYAYLMVARPADPYDVLGDFSSVNGAQGEVLFNKIDAIIDQLVTIGLLPAARGGLIIE